MSPQFANASRERGTRILNLNGEIRCFNRWIILVVGENLARYYKSLYALEYPYKPKFQTPLWGAHVSIVRGECVLPDSIKYYSGCVVEFGYTPEIRTNGVHFWFPAHASIFQQIRDELNLGKPICDFHLSIGNICNGTGLTQPEQFRGIDAVCTNAE